MHYLTRNNSVQEYALTGTAVLFEIGRAVILMASEEILTAHGVIEVPNADSDLVSRVVKTHGLWGGIETYLCSMMIPDAGMVFDVGAYIGTFTLGIKHHVPSARIVAVEPSAMAYDLLRRNVERNLLKSVFLVNCAVDEQSGYLHLTRSVETNRGADVYSSDDNESGGVASTTLKILRDEYGDYRFVKLDVEGYESAAIRGDLDYIARERPVVWAECNEGAASFDTFEVLKALGLMPYYIAFPSIEWGKPINGAAILSRFAYEAAIVGGVERMPSRVLERQDIIAGRIESRDHLREFLWRTPRWALPEWEQLSRPELIGIVGHCHRDVAYSDFFCFSSSGIVKQKPEKTTKGQAVKDSERKETLFLPEYGSGTLDDILILSEGGALDGEPIVDGQISQPSEVSIQGFRLNYVDLLRPFSETVESLRVLELGAGYGNATYGFLNNFQAELYVASEPFESAAKTLRSNLNRWGYKAPKVVVGIYDGNKKPKIPAASVNVIFGHSVLHHVLHWRQMLDYMVNILDSPGILFFGEPFREPWMLTTIVAKIIVERGVSLPTARKLGNFVSSIERRVDRSDDLEYLAQQQDKHLFSFSDIMEYAAANGLEIRFANREGKSSRRMKSLLYGFVTDQERSLVDDVVETILGSRWDGVFSSDIFLPFSLQKK